jgi:N-acetylglucosamine-6-sulfatase
VPRAVALRRGSLAVLLALLLAALGLSPSAAVAGKRGKEPPPLPNIVVIMTDDQELMTEEGQRIGLREKIMPQTHELFSRGGTFFNNFVVTTPVCCPSRATFLTGQYGHNNGVLANKPGYGSLINPESTLPAWLKEERYRTAHVGKWLHGYGEAVGDVSLPAPGWDLWVELLSFNQYYGYQLSVDGDLVRYGQENRDYVTTVLNKRAANWVHEYVEGRRPLFLSVAHMAPHSAKARPNVCTRSALPHRKDYDLWTNERLPLPPNYAEEDVSDKPQFIQDRSQIPPEQSGDLRRKYRCRLASLMDVDRGVEKLVDEFKRKGELAETVFVFTSDNGFFIGEHRLLNGKGLPYEEAIRVPFAIRVPKKYLGQAGVAEPSVDHLAANIDIAPTLLRLADGEPCTAQGTCRAMDGHSLMPLIKGKPGWPEDRQVLIEQRNEASGFERRRDFGPCTYSAIRTPQELYVEYRAMFDGSTGECTQQTPAIIEHYDLAVDPFELNNLFQPSAGSPTEHQAGLSARLEELRQCAGNEEEPVPGSVPCD